MRNTKKGRSLLCQRIQLRYAFIHEQQKAYPLKLLCEIMEVKVLAQISHHSYGSRRIAKGLQNKGYSVGRHAARTLMRKAGISCKQRRRYCVTTQSTHHLSVANNILNREFSVSRPNRSWVTDITYLWTLEGWVYIAAVLDLFSRRVVGWSIANHMRETLVNKALQMALGRRQPERGLLHHFDRGVQYACQDYQSALRTAGIIMSMSRKSNCWDNAVMERFWGSLKSERIHEKTYITREEAKADVIDSIEMFYNSNRLHSTLNYVSPMQFEKQFLLKKVATFT